MTFQVRLVRGGPCPQCGAPVEFESGSAPAQVCKHCRFVVVRTDRDLRAVGKVADLVPMATPFGTGAKGTIDGRPFRVAGRVQYDRIHAPGAPWEEIYLELDRGEWSWLAHAQGRWLLTALYGHPLPVRPPSFAEANPGVVFPVPNLPDLRVVERGQRRFLSAEGELPFPMVPHQVEAYADLAGPGGAFATVDYDTQGIPDHVYFGREIDPRQITLTSGAPLAEPPRAQVTSLVCPKCGGNLPLLAPDQTERIACRYCGMLCDVNQGALVALRPLPLPPDPPAIPLGATGTLRGQSVQVLGYMIRSTVVDDETYAWREYLLYASAPVSNTQPVTNAPPAASTPSGGNVGSFVFLLEEDGVWQHIVPVHAGEAQPAPDNAMTFRRETYRHDQTVKAVVNHVIGEFYWRVEVGESVLAAEYLGPRWERLSKEASADEVQFSHSTPLASIELKKAFPSTFNPPKVSVALEGGKKDGRFFLVLFALWFVVSAVGCVAASGKVAFEKNIPVTQRMKSATGLLEETKSEAVFSDPFRIDGGKNLKMNMRAGPGCLEAEDSWITADTALVHLDSGQVWEDSTDFSDYEKSVWYSRLPEGQYVLRVEPDSHVPAGCGPIHFTLTSGSVPYGYMGISFGILVLLWLFTGSGRGTTKKAITEYAR